MNELTLDPADWDDFRALAHRMVDDTIEHLSSLRDQPAWREMSDEVRAHFESPVPREPQGAARAYDDFVRNVRPYPNGNLHPRFFGWVQGNGTPLGMMADMLAAAINPHMAGFDQAPALVEAQLIRWLISLMGFPETASGVLTLGGTTANLLGLNIARHAKAGFDVREEGERGGPRLMVYASSEVHSWLPKAMELMGMGRASLRTVAVDRDFRMDVPSLRRSIDEDRVAGCRPVCVIGSAGTINSGTADDLVALRAICDDENLWFHVDGAYGAWARLSPSARDAVAGMETADSLAFDLHKWMYQPFDVACVLVRDGERHTAAMASGASYLQPMARGVIAGGLPFADRGIDLTRSFRALKVWISLKAEGVDKFAALIEQNVQQARYVERRVRDSEHLELMAPVPMNVVCFRFKVAGLDEEAADRLNEEIMLRLQESGTAIPSSTRLHGRFCLRCCIVNHRTKRADLDTLVDAVIAVGHEVQAERSM